jgi:aspartate/methionine/tyrosine aminotransferase
MKDSRKRSAKLYAKGTTDVITMAQGCLQANEMVMETLLEPGDNVITYTPSYQQFTDLPVSLGCHVTVLPLIEEQNWQPSLSQLQEAFQKKIKLVILNCPNNPTGTLLNKEYLKELFALAEQNDTYILCDEVYRSPRFRASATCMPKASQLLRLSKMFSLAGLRLGWVKGPSEVINAINVRRDYTIISTGALIDTLGLDCPAAQGRDLIPFPSDHCGQSEDPHQLAEGESILPYCDAAGWHCRLPAV